MSNYATLKAAVQSVVKSNGNKEITGTNMQSTLLGMITSLASGYLFKGVATPSTSPGTPDENVFYIGAAGTYTNFGTSVTVPDGSIAVFTYNGSWAKSQVKLFTEAVGSDFDNPDSTKRAKVPTVGAVIDGLLGNISSLVNGYLFKGVATPSTDTSSPEQNTFYVGAPGTYSNFGTSVTVPDGSIAVFTYNGSWAKSQVKLFTEAVGSDFDNPDSIKRAKVPTVGAVIDGFDGIYDVSARNGGASFASLEALLSDESLSTLIPEQYRKGGMSIRFICDSDDEYVQFRLMSESFDTFASSWQGVDDEPAADSPNLLSSCGAAETYGSYMENPEYINVKTDGDLRILEGLKADGTKEFNVDIELNGDVCTPISRGQIVEHNMFLDVKVDSNNRIIEGVTLDGKKHISDFDNETKEVLKSVIEAGGDVLTIPLLDKDFTCPVQVNITGTKGDQNAKYEFWLPLSEDAYNIRFRFRITENLLNQDKSAVIASVNNAEITVDPIPLTQCVAPTSFLYEGEYHDVNWTTTEGGLSFNGGSVRKKLDKQHLGQEAFSVQYLGEDSATIENTGSAIILTINGTSTSYPFTTYPTVNELYAAMVQNSNIELHCLAIDTRKSNELAIFEPITLRDTFYCGDDGGYGESSNITERIDNPPFYLRYAVSDEWHQAEIVKIGDKLYSTCDGNVSIVSNIGNENKLTLGGNCGVLFKDLEIYANSNRGAEIVYYDTNINIISTANPYIVIFEAHGLYNGPSYTVTPELSENGMSSMSPDTMDSILSFARRKGYVPVSIKEIAEWCVAGGELPKRCYTILFDDTRWNVCMNLELRSVFNRYGTKPALAMVTGRDPTIIHNGVQITKQQASAICAAAGFDIVSHTYNHRSTYGLKPSQYREWLQKDINDADILGADGSILVFPGGATDEYMGDVMEDVGMKAGIGIQGQAPFNNVLRNRFFLSRVNVSRVITGDGERIGYNRFLNRIL